MERLLLYVFVIFLFTACDGSSKSDISTILTPVCQYDSLFVVDLESNSVKKQLRTSSFCSKVKYIALETNKSSLLGRISQVLSKGDTLFILDAIVTKQVQVFLNNGKHIATLGNRGNGPEEYINPTSIGLDNSNIYIYDVSQKEIIYFDAQTLKYKESLKINPDIVNRYISIIDDKIYSDAYVRNGISPFLIQMIDAETGRSEKKWLSTFDYALNYQNSLYFTGDVYFYRVNDGVRYYNMFGDTIMNLTKNSVHPYCVIKSKDFVKKQELDGLRDSHGSKFNDFYNEIKGIYNIKHYVEWDNYIMFYLTQSNFILSVLLDKHTRNFIVANQFYDDLSFKTKDKCIFPIPILGDKLGFYAYVHPLEMEYLLKLYNEDCVSEELKNYIKRKEIKEDSNPILLYYE